MRIGVFGGSFDPPHLGHLSLAQRVQKALELDLVLWVPAGRNPMKPKIPHASGKHRLNMVKALIAEEPKMATSDLEITRGGPSYTVKTLDELQLAMPGQYWILMGADSLMTFTSWLQWDRIIRTARIAAVIREGFEPEVVQRVQGELIQRQLDIVKLESLPYSSTELRTKLSAGESTPEGLAPAVAHYIAENGLYQRPGK